MRVAIATALVLLPLTTTAPAHAAPQTVPLADAVASLPLAAESRDGYVRTSFKHWNSGANPTDGCNTRAEVLISEAVEAPRILPGCKLEGGKWWSYYDAKFVTPASALDVDHLVPLAEAWDSGASQWTAARREAYANDQDAWYGLVAVTAASNRSKADKDPAEWLPPSAEVLCRYGTEWVQVKTRWGLTVDLAEQEALAQIADACPRATVTYESGK